MQTLDFNTYFEGNIFNCQKRFDRIENTNGVKSFYFYNCDLSLEKEYVMVSFVSTESALNQCDPLVTNQCLPISNSGVSYNSDGTRYQPPLLD